MKKNSTKVLTLGAVLTAVVFVLQVLAVLLRSVFPAFAPSLVLVPIVIGAAVGGIGMSTWLGFVFAVAVFVSGDAATFLAIDVAGTVITVFAKGIAAGAVTGAAYKAFKGMSRTLAVALSAIICPLVNTGVFVAGCGVFFLDTLRAWGEGFGYTNVVAYIFLGMIGINFVIELVLNVVLSPAVVRLLNMKEIRSVTK